MFHVAEGRTRAARAREACGVSETRVYCPVEGPRDEGEGTLFTRCGRSSWLEGGALSAPRGLIDRQLYVLKYTCRAIASTAPNRVVSTSSHHAAPWSTYFRVRSIRAATYISHSDIL